MRQEVSILSIPLIATATTETETGAKAIWNRLVRPGLFKSARRLAELSLELTQAQIRDSIRALAAPRSNLLRVEAGAIQKDASKSIALYVHWSPNGAISAMVANQIAAYHTAGFRVFFISMSPGINAPDWQLAKQHAGMMIHRRNIGRDFGAWKDVLELALAEVPDAVELLLVNDSIIGPIRPLDDLWHVLRSGGDGLFGLTENIGGGSHLQSYFLLARGGRAIRDVAAFLSAFKPSSSKWLVVQRGEIGLSRFMKAQGHRVCAVFGYARLIAALVSNPEDRAALLRLDRRFKQHSGPEHALDESRLVQLLHDWPVNPTQHLWKHLVTRFGFPFLKTDLLKRNVYNLPGTAAWPDLVGAQSPCTVETIRAHLNHQPASAGPIPPEQAAALPEAAQSNADSR